MYSFLLLYCSLTTSLPLPRCSLQRGYAPFRTSSEHILYTYISLIFSEYCNNPIYIMHASISHSEWLTHSLTYSKKVDRSIDQLHNHNDTNLEPKNKKRSFIYIRPLFSSLFVSSQISLSYGHIVAFWMEWSDEIEVSYRQSRIHSILFPIGKK